MSDSLPPSNYRVGAYRFMFLTSLVMMTQWAIFSLPSSFFPAAARTISISDSQIGIIFGSFPLGTMMGAAFATPVALRYGATRLVLLSISGAAAMLALFASVPFALSGAGAAAVLSVIRFLNGIASAWVESTMMAIACNYLPDKVGVITGLVEAAIGLGVMIGPIIGSSLHTLSDYVPWTPAHDNLLFIPFMATAAIEVLLLISLLILLPLSPFVPSTNRALSPLAVVKSAGAPFYLASISIALSGFLTDSTNPVMFDIVSLNWSPTDVPNTVALLFLVSGLLYMLLSPVIGYAIDKWTPSPPTLHVILALGFLLQSLCFVLLKPPIMSSKYFRESFNGRASTWAAVLVEAIAISATIIPAVSLVNISLLRARPTPDTEMLNSLTSSSLTFMYAFGATIGPTLAGLTDELGGITAYIWMGISIAFAGVLLNIGISCSMCRASVFHDRVANGLDHDRVAYGLDLSMQQKLLSSQQDE